MKKFLISAVAFILGLSVCTQPVFATTAPETFGVEAAILKDCASKADDADGGGIICILEFVIDIMTIGVGILATIGIGVAGIQYLTAGGNEEKTRKAKRRLFEIILGLAVYVAIYAILQWLLPGFNGLDGI